MADEEEEETMKRLTKAVLTLKIWKEKHGQDLIEYALMAGAVALACAAATPHIEGSFSAIFSKIGSALVAQGG